MVRAEQQKKPEINSTAPDREVLWLRGQLGVAGRRELALQVFDDVERKTADAGDGGHLPQELPGGDEAQVKVLVEEGQGGHVAAQAEELGQHHQPVPRAHRQSHHQQLGEDEGGEGDGHYVHKLGLKEKQRTVHEDAPLIHTD